MTLRKLENLNALLEHTTNYVLKNYSRDENLDFSVKQNLVTLKLDLPFYDASELLSYLEDYNYNVNLNSNNCLEVKL
jgi:hypothetical protein